MRRVHTAPAAGLIGAMLSALSAPLPLRRGPAYTPPRREKQRPRRRFKLRGPAYAHRKKRRG